MKGCFDSIVMLLRYMKQIITLWDYNKNSASEY